VEKGANRTNGAEAMRRYFVESDGVWKSELSHNSLEKGKVYPFPTLSTKKVLWKLTMYGKVFDFPTHPGKRSAKAFPFSTIPTAITLLFFSLNVTFLKSKTM